jgi:dTDP-4-dehydrorhamnose reductase
MSPTATAFIARAILAFLAREGAPGVYHCVNGGAVVLGRLRPRHRRGCGDRRG